MTDHEKDAKARATRIKLKKSNIDGLLADLLDHQDSLVRGTIRVAGGLDEAKELLKNRPDGCNVYDTMYEEYGFTDSFFMVDHNITINLDHLEFAVKEAEQDQDNHD